HVNLRAAGRTSFSCIDVSANAKLGNRVERNVEARVGFLRLFLNAAGVDAIESEVTVIERVTREADCPLGAISIVNRAGHKQHQAGPVSPADGYAFDLILINQTAQLCGATIQRFKRWDYLYGSGDSSDFKSQIHCAGLSNG